MSRLFFTCVLLVLLAGVGGCPEIKGGAVEVAWMVRSSSNSAASCEDPAAPYKIDRIRLRIWSAEEPDRDLCAEDGGPSVCEFSCEDGSGATAFDIPEGTYFFDLVPVTSDGSEIPPSVVVLPAPLRRRIVEGDITDLGIWQIVIL